MDKAGGWIFISHSHQDIDMVRRIRNRFESLGFEPVVFYLKSLTDEDEIEDLIKREIGAREWFVYVDSANARSSKWVRTERDYVASLTDKRIATINLDKNVESQVDNIANQLKVFVSYSAKDRRIAELLKTALTKRELLVFSEDMTLMNGGPCSDRIEEAIRESARSGFCVVVVSKDSANSPWLLREVKSMAAHSSKIVPVYVGGAPLPKNLSVELGDLQGVSIDLNPTEEQIANVVDSIIHRIKFFRSDFRNLLGYRSASAITLPPIGVIDNLTFFDCDNLTTVTIPQSVTYISEDAFDSHPSIFIRCYANSYAEAWCRDHDYQFEVLPA